MKTYLVSKANTPIAVVEAINENFAKLKTAVANHIKINELKALELSL